MQLPYKVLEVWSLPRTYPAPKPLGDTVHRAWVVFSLQSRNCAPDIITTVGCFNRRIWEKTKDGFPKALTTLLCFRTPESPSWILPHYLEHVKQGRSVQKSHLLFQRWEGDGRRARTRSSHVPIALAYVPRAWGSQQEGATPGRGGIAFLWDLEVTRAMKLYPKPFRQEVAAQGKARSGVQHQCSECPSPHKRARDQIYLHGAAWEGGY